MKNTSTEKSRKETIMEYIYSGLMGAAFAGILILGTLI